MISSNYTTSMQRLHSTEPCLNNKNNVYYIGPNFNTWFERGKKSKCDIILGNKASHELNQLITQGKQLGSDHTAVHLRVSSKPICVEIEPIPDVNKANWKLYKSTLEKFSLPCVENVNKEELDLINRKLLDSIESTINNERIFPLKDKIFINNAPVKSMQTQKLEQCIHNYDKKLRQQLGTTTAPQKILKRELYKKYKESRAEDYEKHYQNIADKISGSMKTNKFWDKINKSKGNHINKDIDIKVDGQLVSKEELPNIFKEAWVPVWESNPLHLTPKLQK